MQISRTIVETNDLDAYPALERALGWTSEKAQLSDGAGTYRYHEITVGEITIWRYHAPHRLYHSYEIDGGLLDFILFRDSAGTVWSGYELPPSASLIQRPGGSYWATTPADTVLHGLYLRKELARKFVLTQEPPSKEPTSLKSDILIGTAFEIKRLHDHLDHVLNLTADEVSSPAFETEQVHERLVVALQRFLDVCIPSTQVGSGSTALPRRDLVDEARSLIADRIEGPLSAADLAEGLSVSQRVLELGFRDVLGMGPYHFILNQKLNAARRMLMRQQTSVRAVCDMYGFVNAGRFAEM
ncbi:helix-turn-helix domain-containing protein, partial [Bacteroidota bacterium]